jgi:hypothetical protein
MRRMSEDCAGVTPVNRAEQIAAADRAAISAFRDMTLNPAARLLSFVVRPRREALNSRSIRASASIADLSLQFVTEGSSLGREAGVLA